VLDGGSRSFAASALALKRSSRRSLLRSGSPLEAKEKFGGLRFHLCGGAWTKEMTRVIDGAEREAWNTEECGRPGILRDSMQWYATRCDTHAAPVLCLSETTIPLMRRERGP